MAERENFAFSLRGGFEKTGAPRVRQKYQEDIFAQSGATQLRKIARRARPTMGRVNLFLLI
jgi:hypothetical protein